MQIYYRVIQNFVTAYIDKEYWILSKNNNCAFKRTRELLCSSIIRSCYRSVLFYNTFVLSFCALLYVRVIVLYSSIIRSCYRSVLFYNTFVLSFCALLKSALYILQLCNSQRSNAVAREISNYMQIMWLASIILLYQKLLSKSTWKTFLAVVRFFTIS